MAELCKQHFSIFFSTCGFFVFCFSILVANVVANENRNIDRFNTYTKENTEQRIRISDKLENMSIQLVQRLSRIEAKLDGK